MVRISCALLLVSMLLTACGSAATPDTSGVDPLSLPGGSQPAQVVAPNLPAVTAPVIYSIAMFAPANGWAVTSDPLLLRTVDGGVTWYDASPGGVDLGYSIYPFFLDSSHAWFTVMDTTRNGPSGYPAGVLYRTSDGGESWQTTQVEFIGTFFFLDANTGFALANLGAGAGSQYVAIYRTTDGGASWTQVFTHEPAQSKDLPEGGMKSGLVYSDGYNAWIGGNIPMDNYLYFFHSNTGGATWSQVELALPASVTDVFAEVQAPVFFGPVNGILPVRLLSFSGENSYAFYRTDTSGLNWVAGQTLANVTSYDFLSAARGFASDGASLFSSGDGGASWGRVADAPAGTAFLSIDFVDELHGWALTTTDAYSLADLSLYRTGDGGRNWERLLP